MQDIEFRAERFSRLCRMEQELSSSTDLDELLAKIIQCSKELTEAESASILLHEKERDELYFRQAMGELGQVIKTVRIPLSQPSIAGYTFKHRKAQIINDVAADPRHFKGVDQATAIPTRTLLAVPIVWGDRVYGVIEAVNKRGDGGFDEGDREALTVLAGHAAVAIHNVNLVEQLQNFFVHTLEIFVSALECVEPFSRGHVIRVTRMATGVARELGLPREEYETIWYGAYLHDIGKLLLGSAFVSRSDRQHPVVGASRLSRIKVLERVAPIVRHHHERWDGSGFPDALSGPQIPLGARIVALAEDYDEQYMDLSPEQPLEEFRERFFDSAVVRHDPELVPPFVKVLERLSGE